MTRVDLSTDRGAFPALRTTRWVAEFVWRRDSSTVGRQINSYHEDYPGRVGLTDAAIRWVAELARSTIHRNVLLDINGRIFPEASWSGSWRRVQVRIGRHSPPPPEAIPAHMEELRAAYPPYKEMSIYQLVRWYWDFETLHPFQDGNGRVGGVLVAAVSHALDREKRWLTVCQ